MTIRFFMLQAHYRSTLDFSNEALQGAEKGLKRMMTAYNDIDGLKAADSSSVSVPELREKLYAAMNDDFNSPIAIAHLFEAVKWINLIKDGKESLTIEDIQALKEVMTGMIFEVLGLQDEASDDSSDKIDGLMQFVLRLRQDAKANKDYVMSDSIRDQLKELGFEIKDGKDGTTYTAL